VRRAADFLDRRAGEAVASDPTLQRWRKAMKAGGEEAAATMRELVSAQANKNLPPPVKDPKVVGPLMKSVWQQCTATVDKFNEPGRFTTMIGFEWTSVPGAKNLHRNVMFRDGKPLGKEMMPSNYLRYGLLQGMAQEQKLGVNPFDFGVAGSTGVQDSPTSIEEENFYGKQVDQEPRPGDPRTAEPLSPRS
jgi:hypothetical protein